MLSQNARNRGGEGGDERYAGEEEFTEIAASITA